jgi:hypothetical protein
MRTGGDGAWVETALRIKVVQRRCLAALLALL